MCPAGGLELLTAIEILFELRVEHGGEAGVEVPADLWTTCFTPRELRLLASAAGLTPRAIWSVTPGDYAARPPDVEHHEFLLMATRVS